MRVFNVDADLSYQWIGLANTDIDNVLDLITYDCEEKKQDWFDLQWYIINPKAKVGNFYYSDSGSLVFDEDVYNSDLRTSIEMAGQILPIVINGKKLYLLNILQCINALNVQESKFDLDADGSNGRLLEYSFHRRLTESTLFKIPETSKFEVLTYSDVKDLDDEFYYLYKKLNFKGLEFIELYKK